MFRDRDDIFTEPGFVDLLFRGGKCRQRRAVSEFGYLLNIRADVRFDVLVGRGLRHTVLDDGLAKIGRKADEALVPTGTKNNLFAFRDWVG
jgi:hypothetical protein